MKFCIILAVRDEEGAAHLPTSQSGISSSFLDIKADLTDRSFDDCISQFEADLGICEGFLFRYLYEKEMKNDIASESNKKNQHQDGTERLIGIVEHDREAVHRLMTRYAGKAVCCRCNEVLVETARSNDSIPLPNEKRGVETAAHEQQWEDASNKLKYFFRV
ncbi:hypothetical protein ACVK00_006699 [Burkholderia sp. PvR073]|uniref:hypothetical protein n=1 Tax=Burkholderia TaxID=32008 RepID=UPI00254E59E6|nr:hypothetical protein [Burkholderia sp. lyk4-R2A-23]